MLKDDPALNKAKEVLQKTDVYKNMLLHGK
jgi:hypothetical protein